MICPIKLHRCQTAITIANLIVLKFEFDNGIWPIQFVLYKMHNKIEIKIELGQ